MISSYFSIIASLFVIEVLLSIDNALVNATLAESLPEQKRVRAIRLGIILGAVFRLIALLAVAIIIQNPWLKVAGGIYLIYLAIAHIGKVVDDTGKTLTVKTTFRGVITQIAIADIVFSIDNVISAVSFSSNTFVVMLGVGVGVVSMLFITPILSTLVHRYKGMASAAYVIVGLIGVTLLLETLLHLHISEMVKFMVIALIMVFTVTYEHSSRLRAIANPVLTFFQYVIALPLDIIYEIKAVLIVAMKGK